MEPSRFSSSSKARGRHKGIFLASLLVIGIGGLIFYKTQNSITRTASTVLGTGSIIRGTGLLRPVVSRRSLHNQRCPGSRRCEKAFESGRVSDEEVVPFYGNYFPGKHNGVRRRKTSMHCTTIDWFLDDNEDDDRYKMRENKLLHTVYLVDDLERTVDFCTKALGMKVLRTRQLPKQGATCVYVGYGPEGEFFTIQLYGKTDAQGYDLGDSFWGYALTLPHESETDVLDDAKLKPLGGSVADPMSMWVLGPNMVPDEDVNIQKPIERGYGYGPAKLVFEVNNGTVRDPLARVRMRVTDLEKSISFYESLGMKLHQKRAHLLDEPFDTRLTAIMGFGENEHDSGNIELIYVYNTKELDLGERFRQLSVSTKNVTAAVERMTEDGYKFFKEPAKLDSIDTEVAALRDPDGYVVVLVKEEDFMNEIAEAASPDAAAVTAE